jgi:hypothetical protein
LRSVLERNRKRAWAFKAGPGSWLKKDGSHNDNSERTTTTVTSTATTTTTITITTTNPALAVPLPYGGIPK